MPESPHPMQSPAEYIEEWKKIMEKKTKTLYGWSETDSILAMPAQEVKECVRFAAESWDAPDNVVIIDAWFGLVGGFFAGAQYARTVIWSTAYEWIDKITDPFSKAHYKVYRLENDCTIGECMKPNSHLVHPGIYILLSEDRKILRAGRMTYKPIFFRGVVPDPQCQELLDGTQKQCFFTQESGVKLTATYILPPSSSFFKTDGNKHDPNNPSHNLANLFMLREGLLDAWHNFHIIVDVKTGHVIPLVKGYKGVLKKKG